MPHGDIFLFGRFRRQPYGGNFQAVPDALGRELETSRAAVFIRRKLGNHAAAISRVARNFHRGAAGFQPINGQRTRRLPIRCAVPTNRNPPLASGKRAVFCGIGRQFMEHRRYRLGSFRAEDYVGPLDARVAIRSIGGETLAEAAPAAVRPATESC